MIFKHCHVSDQDLLLAVDSELSARRRSQVHRHIQACESCRKRQADLAQTLSNFTAAYQSSEPYTGHNLEYALKTRLTTASSARIPTAWDSARWRAAASLALLVLLLWTGVWVARHRQPASPDASIIPNPTLTPGEAATVSSNELCREGVPAQATKIPDSLREAVFSEYGMKNAPREAYEVDFLITPELGGAASMRNLWPEPYHQPAWNAHTKDRLEDRLHSLVCSGNLDLATAQHEIATNWVSAYKKYVATDDPI